MCERSVLLLPCLTSLRSLSVVFLVRFPLDFELGSPYSSMSHHFLYILLFLSPCSLCNFHVVCLIWITNFCMMHGPLLSPIPLLSLVFSLSSVQHPGLKILRSDSSSSISSRIGWVSLSFHPFPKNKKRKTVKASFFSLSSLLPYYL